MKLSVIDTLDLLAHIRSAIYARQSSIGRPSREHPWRLTVVIDAEHLHTYWPNPAIAGAAFRVLQEEFGERLNEECSGDIELERLYGTTSVTGSIDSNASATPRGLLQF